ncbi:hypothetical protein [Methanobrevibacter arboriphilus]|uniref:Uncharacterized protein n=1 Tax=Methanobrevibacter arboriphilus TaxID=39441 RepID=A0ACA8R531_METAZ|nr:hypothetical protein [Methanobrevibacter arboriphilus]BBL62410.1 hypothetical protein MarbSA_14500 [Methanobrevibacter arboriphilus]
MNTIITLEGVPFEGFEHANFIASLIKLFEDFDIPIENVSYSGDLEGRIYKISTYKGHYNSLNALLRSIADNKVGPISFDDTILYKDNNSSKDWKELF